jgi:hypothetical protein
MSYNPVNTDSRSNSPVPFDRHYLPYGQQQQHRYAFVPLSRLWYLSVEGIGGNDGSLGGNKKRRKRGMGQKGKGGGEKDSSHVFLFEITKPSMGLLPISSHKPDG